MHHPISSFYVNYFHSPFPFVHLIDVYFSYIDSCQSTRGSSGRSSAGDGKDERSNERVAKEAKGKSSNTTGNACRYLCAWFHLGRDARNIRRGNQVLFKEHVEFH